MEEPIHTEYDVCQINIRLFVTCFSPYMELAIHLFNTITSTVVYIFNLEAFVTVTFLL